MRRHVEREADAAVAGQLAGAGDQLVAHQVVADERHPTLDQTAGRQPVEQVARAARAPRPPARRTAHRRRPIPTGRSSPACRPTRTAAATRSGWATVPASTVHVMPLVTASIAPSVADNSSSSPVWARVHRHRPAEDRLLRVDRVGDARVHQPIARQVLMGVHVAGCHQRLGVADHRARRGARPAARPTARRPR